jgi:hypothetical protein
MVLTLSLHLLKLCAVVTFLLLGSLRCTLAQYQRLRALDTTAVGQIEGLYLINADTDRPIQVLRNGSLIITTNLGTSNFSIEARGTNGTVGSVQFGYNNISNFRVEKDAPFAFCGNSGDNFIACSVLVQGEHTIKATPFYNQTARRPAGTPFQVTFTIVDTTSVPTDTPTKAPTTWSPTKTPTSGAPTTFLSTKAPTKAPTSRPTYAPVSCSIPRVSVSKSICVCIVSTRVTFAHTHFAASYHSKVYGDLAAVEPRLSHCNGRAPRLTHWQ